MQKLPCCDYKSLQSQTIVVIYLQRNIVKIVNTNDAADSFIAIAY